MYQVRPLTIAVLALAAGSLLIAGPSLAQSKKSKKKSAKHAKAAKAAPAPKFADIQTIFTANCMPCHSADNHKAGVNLSTYADLMKGNREGPIVKAGDPAKSFIIRSLRHQPGAAPMPARKPALDEATIKKVEGWIKAGAKEK